MGLTVFDYRKSILELAQAERREIAVPEFYDHIVKKNTLSDDDLVSTTLRGQQTKEPRWKRNLRNTLQQLKADGELVNIKKDYWRLPTPKLETSLNNKTSWDLICAMANESLENNVIWNSSQKGKTYKVKKVDVGNITVYCEQFHEEESLNEVEVYRAITCLNAAGGIVGRRTLNNVVAKETAIVFLHPLLDWFDDGNQIGVILANAVAGEDDVFNENIVLREIENDQIGIYDIIKRKRRKAQDRFKDNLMIVYDGKCCISGVDVENVLSGAHIEPHYINGDNSSCNGLLLRADVHKLFDDGLIAINPQTLEVLVDRRLQGTIYSEFNGQKLFARLDGKKPNVRILAERWKSLPWTK